MDRLLMELTNLRDYYSNLLMLRQNERAKIEGGYITIENRAGRTFFYENHGSKRKGITKDKPRVAQLSRANYLDLEIKGLSSALSKLNRILEGLRGDRGDARERFDKRFSGAGDVRTKAILTPLQLRSAGRQSQNSFMPESLNVTTKSGIMVRSLSEQTWADMYHELGIPFRYEMKIKVDVTGMGQIPGAYHEGGRFYKDYYPDFTLFLADNSIIIHEHLGLINDENYIYKAGERIIAYTDSGLITPDRLLLTFPDDVRNPERFRRLLKKKVQPYV